MLCMPDMGLLGSNTVLESCNLYVRLNERVLATLSFEY